MIATKPIVAFVIVGLGIVQLIDVRLPAVPRLGMTRIIQGHSAAVTLFAYGFGYGLASTGCTLPPLHLDHGDSTDEWLFRVGGVGIRGIRVGDRRSYAGHDAAGSGGEAATHRSPAARGDPDQEGEWPRADRRRLV